MASVTYEAVTLVYPNAKAPTVNNFDLEVADGEFLVLVGPSGCGKSTTLRMLAGLEDVTAGRILIGDTDVTTAPPKERDIAMVFQNYALYPHMSVRENMGFALKIAGMPKDQIDKQVETMAKRLDLLPYLDRKPKALSGGQPWAAPLCGSRKCSSWTSRFRTWMRNCGCRPVPKSPPCNANSASPPSM